MWLNRKRDEAGVEEGFEHAYEDDLTDLKVGLESRKPQPCQTNRWVEPAVPLHLVAVILPLPGSARAKGICTGARRFDAPFSDVCANAIMTLHRAESKVSIQEPGRVLVASKAADFRALRASRIMIASFCPRLSRHIYVIARVHLLHLYTFTRCSSAVLHIVRSLVWSLQGGVSHPRFSYDCCSIPGPGLARPEPKSSGPRAWLWRGRRMDHGDGPKLLRLRSAVPLPVRSPSARKTCASCIYTQGKPACVGAPSLCRQLCRASASWRAAIMSEAGTAATSAPATTTTTNTATAHTFIQFAEQPPKRKRAEAVCIPCHSKKVKCDIQKRQQHGLQRCSNCDSNQRVCQLRPSQRGKRKQSVHEDTHGQSEAETQAADYAVDGAGTLLPADPNLICPDASRNDGQPPITKVPRLSRASDLQASQGARDDASVGGRQSTPMGSREEISTHCSRDNDVDAGYLQVYGPENQFDAEMQELQAQLVPARESNDALSLDPCLQATFLETYWEYCYCFCPVLDRLTVKAEMARSPLLTNAVALAASHVQPPLLPHDGPETYYDRARKLFYEDHEADNLTALKALSLFYWWAPRPPSTLHRHTSWWWQSVIISHAQQMGIHRQPPLESPLNAHLDLSVRRRIWWSAFVSGHAKFYDS